MTYHINNNYCVHFMFFFGKRMYKGHYAKLYGTIKTWSYYKLNFLLTFYILIGYKYFTKKIIK